MRSTFTCRWIFLVVFLFILLAATVQADDQIIQPDFPELFDVWEDYEHTHLDEYYYEWSWYLSEGDNRSSFESFWADALSDYGISAKQTSTFTDYMAKDQEDAAFEYLLGLLSAPASNSPISTSKTISNTVIRDIITPAIKSRSDKKKAAAAKKMGTPKTLGGYLRYENVERKEDDGYITGASMGLEWDGDLISYGFLVPYDYFNFDSFNGNRIGSIFFAKYIRSLTGELDLGVTGNVNYFFMDIHNFDTVNNFGGGLSTSLTYDTGTFVPKVALSYQYNKDDTNSDMDDQQTFLATISCGFRLGDNATLEVYSIYSLDVSSYASDFDDTDSFDTGIEATYNLTDSFCLSGGYKTVLGLSDYESHMVYFGGRFAFH